MPENGKWFIIVNPVSGFGRAQKKWRHISHELKKQDVVFECEYTTEDERGDKLAQKAISMGYSKLICVGGDGHLHDMINGVMKQKLVPTTDITIGMISQGTGNDWIKTNGMPKHYKRAIKVIKEGKTAIQNAGLARAFKDGKPVEKYFHNFAGVGFDAVVVQQTSSLKGYGQIAYLLAMLKAIWQYEKPVLKITFDKETVETVTYLTMTGIGQYAGGGMKLTPGAKPDGETFYTTIAKNFSKFDVIRYTGKLFDGSFINLSEAEFHLSKHVTIEVVSSKDSVYMEADGDLIGTGPFDITLIPKALKVIVP